MLYDELSGSPVHGCYYFLFALFEQGHGSDVDYIKPRMVHVGENVKALEISCGFNHTGTIFEYV